MSIPPRTRWPDASCWDGNRPDPDSVRVEEFVNYFDQEYPQPRRDAFGIHVDGRTLALHPRTRGSPAWAFRDATFRTTGARTRPLSSSSTLPAPWRGRIRLGLVQRAWRLLVRELRPTDQIGIVTYGSRGHAILNPTEARHDDYIIEVIDGLRPGGSTNAEEGLKIGYEMADRWLDPRRITRVILLSDGVANVGQTGPDVILQRVRRYVNEGVNLSTVGVGMGNYNDVSWSSSPTTATATTSTSTTSARLGSHSSTTSHPLSR